jgi:Na+-transporting methylmalonyl-CoA/oxaloacetate decarboxylase beta subunit
MDIAALGRGLWESTGFVGLTGKQIAMLGIACVLLYLAIFRKFEPLLLLPIGFGALLANPPFAPVMSSPVGDTPGGLFYYLKVGVEKEIFPPLIFLGGGEEGWRPRSDPAMIGALAEGKSDSILAGCRCIDHAS